MFSYAITLKHPSGSRSTVLTIPEAETLIHLGWRVERLTGRLFRHQPEAQSCR